MNDFTLFDKLPDGFRLATEEDLPLVNLTLAQAFADYQYPIPSVNVPYSALLKFYYGLGEACARNSLEHGAVLTNDDFSAVMLIAPWDQRADYGIEKLYEDLKESGGKEAADNLLKIMEYIADGEGNVPVEENTVFVDMFAVQTPKQGQKLGSKLMRELFEQCEKKGRDVLLYTNTERNKSIYNHFGFETVVTLHKDDLNSDTFFLRWQPPQKAKARLIEKLKDTMQISSFYPMYICAPEELSDTVASFNAFGMETLHHFRDGQGAEGYVLGNDRGNKLDVFTNPNIRAESGLFGMRVGVSDLDKAIDFAKKNNFTIESNVITTRTNRSIFTKAPFGLNCMFMEHFKPKKNE